METIKPDVFIPCANKDLDRLGITIEAVRQQLEIGNVYVCTPNRIDPIGAGVSQLTDRDAMHRMPELCYRPNWVRQQFIKLFQTVTSDWYFVIDADTVVLQPLPLFIAERPIWFTGNDQYHRPYFRFQREMFGYWREPSEKSFCSHTGLYHRPLVNEMLQESGYESVDHFLDRSAQVINDICHPAEFEIYMGYVTRAHPELYFQMEVRLWEYGLHDDQPPHPISLDQLKTEGFDLASLHRWDYRAPGDEK